MDPSGVVTPTGKRFDVNRTHTALRCSAERLQKRSGIIATVSGKESAPRLSATVEITLFRVAQECLSDLAKHACASAATIRLEIESRLARLTITDNGNGFDAGTILRLRPEHGWGIRIMRGRLAAVGGRLYAISASGRGTRIVAEAARKS